MPERPQVVIVGAGFGGLSAAKRLEREPVDVILIDQHNYHTFQPLLYQVATSGLNPADVGYATRGMFRRQQRVFFRKGKVTGVDWATQHVLLKYEEPIRFDYLIIAAGSSTNYFGVPGADEFAFPLYGLEDSIRLRNHILSLCEASDSVPALLDEGVLHFVIVGGGPSGVEVAGAMAELVDKVLAQDFHDLDVRRARIILVEQASGLLGAFSTKSSEYALRTLEQRGVEVWLNTAVKAITPDHIVLGDNTVVATRTLVWAAGVRASDLAADIEATQGRGGRITVNTDLSIPGYPNAFAIGDVADISDGKADGKEQLGWLVPNHRIREACFAGADARREWITIEGDARVTGLARDTQQATLTLADGRTLTAPPAIAADSRCSRSQASSVLVASANRRFSFSMTSITGSLWLAPKIPSFIRSPATDLGLGDGNPMMA